MNRPMDPSNKALLSFPLVLKRTYETFRNITRSFPLYAISIILLTIITGILPVVNLWISKLLIDSVVAYLASSGSAELLKPVLLILGLQLGIGLVTLFLSQGNSNISFKLSQLVTFKMQQEIYRHCLRMDYNFFEIPEQQDRLYRSQYQSATAANSLFTTVISLGRSTITILSSSAALLLFSPILCMIAILIAIPNAILNIKLAFENYEIIRKRSERLRKGVYLSSLLIARNHVRDNILFGVGHYFFQKWKNLQQKTLSEDLRIQLKRRNIAGIIGLINNIAHVAAYVYIVLLTVKKSGTVGSVMMNVGLFANAQGQIQGIATDLADLYQNAIFLNDYYDLQLTKSKIEQQKDGIPIDGRIDSITFENVSFRYPNSKRYTLKDVSFEIDSEECISFVGANGAGKSTIIKLILRIYDPTSGRILINGINIKDYSIKELRRTFAVLMQDFSMYLFSVKENIIVGDIRKADDRALLQKSIDAAGLQETVNGLPNRDDTILGKIFGKGEDLSIGEWQRLALARVFFRSAPVMILDEPTSALDATMESLILERFRKMTKRKISIIVSHRFSSALIADRIIVIDSGKVAEAGTHIELMEKNGLYAKMFRIQRRRYIGDDLADDEIVAHRNS